MTYSELNSLYYFFVQKRTSKRETQELRQKAKTMYQSKPEKEKKLQRDIGETKKKTNMRANVLYLL